MKTIECRSCHRQIDELARLCPYCGADPVTGQRFDPAPLLEKHFPRKAELSAHESILEYVRQRQTIVVAVVVGCIFLLALGLHQMIVRRNANTASDVPAIPLTEVADLSNAAAQNQQVAIPALDFDHEGDAKTLRTLLMEPGAVAPPPPVPLSGDSTTAVGAPQSGAVQPSSAGQQIGPVRPAPPPTRPAPPPGP